MNKSCYREWCTNCNNWEIFDFISGEELQKLSDKENAEKRNVLYCTSCNTKLTDRNISIKNIPESKILEQRYRYKNYKIQSLAHFMGGAKTDFFDSPKKLIVESDAGLENEAREKEAINREKLIQYNKTKEELQKFKHCERNDPCLCGSGKKFKKCHLRQCESYGIK